MDNYLTSGRRNNFFDEEEVDDDEFLRHPKSGSTGYALPTHPAARQPTTGGGQLNNRNSYAGSGNEYSQQRDLDSHRQELAMKRREIEERTLASSERGLGLLYESEKVGLATAEELTRQKEQLLRTESRLDEINSTLRNSEKHIQGIRSVFGSIRNYFSGRSPAATGSGAGTPAQPGSQTALPPSSSSPSQLGTRFGGGGGGATPTGLQQNDSYADHHPAMRNKPGFNTTPADVDAALDKNLDDMASGLARLKGLAQGLNEELNDHGEIIDRVNVKSEDAKFKIDRQNRDMAKLLGKK